MAIDVSNTPDMYTIEITGTFTFNTNCAVRNTPDMDATGVATYTSGESVNYDSKVKNGNHLWVSYLSSSGTRHYVPYANTDSGTYFGTDSNPVDPIESADSTGNTDTTGNGDLGTLTGQTGADAAANTPDGTTLTESGSFTFSEAAAGREQDLMSATHVDSFAAGDTVVYDAKIKNDSHYWLQYSHYGEGTYYVPYATISPFRYYGNDSNPGDPVYSTDDTGTGTGTGTSRPQGEQDTGTPTLSGAVPLDSLAGYEFPMCYDDVNKCWVKMQSTAATRSEPTFTDAAKTGADHKVGDTVHYLAKTDGTEHTRMWVKFENGNYLPIGQLSTLSNVAKYSYGTRQEMVGYVEDQNSSQPWEYIWPYAHELGGTTTNKDNETKTISSNATPWEVSDSLDNDTPSIGFTPSSTEIDALNELHAQVSSGAHDDDVLIAYITDTHLDSYQSPGTTRVLHSMMLMSYYAKTFGVDLMVHGGDLNDGVKPKALSEIDVQRGVDAMKLGQRPYIILQGNHDDNSGYTRDVAGYKTDELIDNSEAWNLRSSALDRVSNTNDAVYGTYTVPNSNITIIVLDGFDQTDVNTTDYRETDGAVHFDSFRHGYTHYSQQQINWLQNVALPAVPSGNKVLFFNHISLNGIPSDGWMHEASLFENNDSTNAKGVAESHQIYEIITQYQATHDNVIGYIAGHTHYDDHVKSGNVQFVTQTCGLSDRGDGALASRNANTSLPVLRDNSSIYNNAWTILRISPSAGKIDQFRFGWKNEAQFLQSWNFQRFNEKSREYPDFFHCLLLLGWQK